jgi:EmrB/QacA subfamily drug resistance transporter
MDLFHRLSETFSSKRNVAVTGVMLVIFLFAIDATIVSTSMPTIVARLGGLDLYSWIFSIYMLTSALTTPIFGKLSDLFSRRRLMLVGIGIFVTGSALCGAAQSMEMMIVFRALQGLGGGAIYALSFIIVGVLYTHEQRARMQGIISSIWGIASILGPLAGGIIVEHWSWRWIFFVNLPITAIACALIVFGLKEEAAEKRRPKLDLSGAALLMVALVLLFYALSEGAHAGRTLNSALVSTVGVAFFVLAVFFVVEKRAEEPLVPPNLFSLKLFRNSVVVSIAAAMGVFGALTYIPLYLQGVLGMSASHAGSILLLLSLSWTGGSLLSGHWVHRTGYRLAASAGMILLAGGYALLISHSQIGIMLILCSAVMIGIGMGFANLTTLVAAQSAVSRERIGVATSTIMLLRSIGGALVVSVMGTVLLNRMQSGLAAVSANIGKTVPASVMEIARNPQDLLDPAIRGNIPPDLLPLLTNVLARATWSAFLIGFVLMLCGLAASLLIERHASERSIAESSVPNGDRSAPVELRSPSSEF